MSEVDFGCTFPSESFKSRDKVQSDRGISEKAVPVWKDAEGRSNWPAWRSWLDAAADLRYKLAHFSCRKEASRGLKSGAETDATVGCRSNSYLQFSNESGRKSVAVYRCPQTWWTAAL